MNSQSGHAARTRLRRAAVVALACAVAVGTAACSPSTTAGITYGDREVITAESGVERTATVYHPESAGAGAPLVVVLHGAGGDGATIRESVGLDDLARTAGFVVAYPDALDHRWNAGICCRTPKMPDVDDVAYLHDLRERLVGEDQVDPSRVYAMGMSNGGMLSYAWACHRPGDLAGIGVMAAALVTDCPDPTPLTVVAMQGTADAVVPIDGRIQGNRELPPLAESLAPFQQADACPAEPTTENTATTTVSTWLCGSGHSVVSAVIEGAKHSWPSPARLGFPDRRSGAEFLWQRLTTGS